MKCNRDCHRCELRLKKLIGYCGYEFNPDTVPVMGSVILNPWLWREVKNRRESLKRALEEERCPPKPQNRDGIYWYWDGEKWVAH